MSGIASTYLLLHKARVRGLGSVIDSQWFSTGNSLTVFSVSESFDTQGFMEAFQTINPPYPILERQPFHHYPNITRQGKYQKRVRPERRTISLSIFIAQPECVRRLAECSPHLYEADRIEVGRRMNYTSWINFVEIASSTRWSEIAGDVERLVAKYGVQEYPGLQKLLASLKPTDRVKGEVLEALESYLVSLSGQVGEKELKEMVQSTLWAAQRQRHFSGAKQLIEQFLPVVYIVGREGMNSTEQMDSAHPLSSLFGKIDELLLREKDAVSPPVFLIDEMSCCDTHDQRERLRDRVFRLSETNQCLLFTSSTAPFQPRRNVTLLGERDLRR